LLPPRGGGVICVDSGCGGGVVGGGKDSDKGGGEGKGKGCWKLQATTKPIHVYLLSGSL
jgi:hypothetical protein